jgi:hypothetical protein
LVSTKDRHHNPVLAALNPPRTPNKRSFSFSFRSFVAREQQARSLPSERNAVVPLGSTTA